MRRRDVDGELENTRLHLQVKPAPGGTSLTVTDPLSGSHPVRDGLLQFSPIGPVDPSAFDVQSDGTHDLVQIEDELGRGEDRLGTFQEGPIHGITITSAHGALTTVQRLWLEDGEAAMRATATITNTGSQNVPLHGALCRLDGMRLGWEWDDEWIFPATYSNNVYTHGRIDSLRDEGIAFSFMPIGLYLPYAILHDPSGNRGIIYSSWLDTRFSLHLEPSRERQSASLCTLTSIERVLFPGESHVWGEWRLVIFAGDYYKAMEEFRSSLVRERGLCVPADTPAFLPDTIMANLSFNFERFRHGFASDEVTDYLESVKRLGANCLYVNGQWRSGLYHTVAPEPEWRNPCIMLPELGWYEPEDAYGGRAGHQVFLANVHRLGLRAIAWITMSGLGFESEQVRDHAEWFLHGEAGEIRSSFRSKKVKHIADANFLSPGWRSWFLENVKRLRELDYDGVFLDGIIPKKPDTWTYPWPGRGQNGAIDQVREIRRELKTLSPDFLLVTEDCGCHWNALAEISLDRYHLRLPSRPPRRDDPSPVRATPLNDGAYPRIGPADVLDYLRIGQLSLLPGARALAYDLKYHGLKSFPWMYLGALSDLIPVVFHEDKITYKEEQIYRLPREEQGNEHLEDRFSRELRAALALRRERVELRRARVLFDALRVEPPGVVGFARPYTDCLSLVIINFWPETQDVHAEVTGLEALGISDKKAYRLVSLLDPDMVGFPVRTWSAAQPAGIPAFQLAGYGAAVIGLEVVEA